MENEDGACLSESEADDRLSSAVRGAEASSELVSRLFISPTRAHLICPYIVPFHHFIAFIVSLVRPTHTYLFILSFHTPI